MFFSGENHQLYRVLQEKKVDRVGKDLMGSAHVYDISSTGGVFLRKGQGVDVALDPSDLELDAPEMSAKLEEQLKQQQNATLAKEDFSDMVADHAARQKRKKQQDSSSNKNKKYKDFKF